LAILSALIVVIQLLSGIIRIGSVNLSFVLVPIVIGAIAIGPLGGAILGFIFGLVCFFMGLGGMDFFTNFLISHHPIMTFLTCVVKGSAAGFCSGLIFKLLLKKNDFVGVVLASICAPIINTGLFIVGALIMSDAITAYMSEVNLSVDIMYFLVILCAGINFIVEFIINAVLSPSLYRISKYVRGRKY